MSFSSPPKPPAAAPPPANASVSAQEAERIGKKKRKAAHQNSSLGGTLRAGAQPFNAAYSSGYKEQLGQ